SCCLNKPRRHGDQGGAKNDIQCDVTKNEEPFIRLYPMKKFKAKGGESTQPTAKSSSKKKPTVLREVEFTAAV
ncbi:MAG: hypothetical protein RL521_1190, partial [Bacteroidota bacterium]